MIAFLLGLLVFAVIWFIVNAALTGIAIWSVNEIFNFDMPFWPVFWLLIVLAAVFGGSAKAGSSK